MRKIFHLLIPSILLIAGCSSKGLPAPKETKSMSLKDIFSSSLYQDKDKLYLYTGKTSLNTAIDNAYRILKDRKNTFLSKMEQYCNVKGGKTIEQHKYFEKFKLDYENFEDRCMDIKFGSQLSTPTNQMICYKTENNKPKILFTYGNSRLYEYEVSKPPYSRWIKYEFFTCIPDYENFDIYFYNAQKAYIQQKQQIKQQIKQQKAKEQQEDTGFRRF